MLSLTILLEFKNRRKKKKENTVISSGSAQEHKKASPIDIYFSLRFGFFGIEHT